MSKKDLSYLEPDGTRIVPEVIEPSVGVDRLFYAIVCEKYDVEKVGEEEREVLHLPYSLCPYKCAILPLSNKLSDKAYPIYLNLLKKGISCQYDISGSIGKRYRRQDAIGTMYCITYDFESEANGTVTIRNRDTMKQEVVKIEDINKYIF
jgi:glycyl-tRNA synthetase